jgi:hypothetical protein
MFLVGLEPCLEDLRNLETCLTKFESKMQKIEKKEKTEKENEKK